MKKVILKEKNLNKIMLKLNAGLFSNLNLPSCINQVKSFNLTIIFNRKIYVRS